MKELILLSKKEMDTLAANTAAVENLRARVTGEDAALEIKALVDLAPTGPYTATGHTQDTQSEILRTQGVVAYRAALLYQLTGDTAHAKRAQYIIDRWSRTLRRIEGLQAQSVIAFHFPLYVIAAGWVRGVNKWSGNGFGDFCIDRILPMTRRTYKNNIAAWWCALEAAIYSYTNNYNGLRKTSALWRYQVMAQVCSTYESTGSICYSPYTTDIAAEEPRRYVLPDEVSRSDSSDFHGGATKGKKGLDYTHFALHAWTLAAEILLKEGDNVYDTDEAAVFEQAFYKTVGWVKTPSTFPYYALNGGVLTNVTKCGYFAPLCERFTGSGISDALTLLASPIIGYEYQLDFLFGGRWNLPD